MVRKHLMAIFSKIVLLIWVILVAQMAFFLDLDFFYGVHFIRCNLGPVYDQSLLEKFV